MYEFGPLKLNFQSITMTYTEFDEEDDRDLLKGDWNDVQDIVHRLDETAFERIKFKTRDAQQNKIIEEHHDVPSTLKSYVAADAQGLVVSVKEPNPQGEDKIAAQDF